MMTKTITCRLTERTEEGQKAQAKKFIQDLKELCRIRKEYKIQIISGVAIFREKE